MLDRTEQRVVGVLVEMGLCSHEAYPAAEFDLRLGSNRYDHRDPVMDLKPAEVAGAVATLLENGWIERLDAGPRGSRFRHLLVERYSLQPVELGILCELLLHGPETAEHLRERMRRFSLDVDTATVVTALRALAERPQPLVVPMPPGPRERDRRWAHLLTRRRPDVWMVSPAASSESSEDVAGAPAAGSGRTEPNVDDPTVLVTRIERLEGAVDRLQRQVATLQAGRLDEVLLGR